jgi:hypothetical protein
VLLKNLVLCFKTVSEVLRKVLLEMLLDGENESFDVVKWNNILVKAMPLLIENYKNYVFRLTLKTFSHTIRPIRRFFFRKSLIVFHCIFSDSTSGPFRKETISAFWRFVVEGRKLLNTACKICHV